jgi:hypothetical protein
MSDALENGIAAYKNGDKARAGQYLQQALKENPQNISAWLWLSVLVNGAEQKRYCFQKVLAIDPGNVHALKGLNVLVESVKKPAFAETQEKSVVEQKPVAAPEQPGKRFEYLGSIEALSTPWDVYEPHMPSVDIYSDLEFFFENARVLGQKAARTGFVPEFLKACPEFEGRIVRTDPGSADEKSVAIISPGRIVFLVPAVPNKKNKNPELPGEGFLPNKKHLKITVISYTNLPAVVNIGHTAGELIQEGNKCIPFLGFLLAFAAILGHSVLVFEGHPSAFEAGVKNSDVLMIDSAMLKYLQEDWAEVAFRCMNPHAKIFIHEREGYKLRSVIRKNTAPGWEYGIGAGGEPNYVQMIIMVLAENKLRGKHLLLEAGKRLPNLAKLTTKPDELEFFSKIPFDYELLDANKVIDLILAQSEQKFLSSTRIYKTKYQEKGGGKIVDVVFNLIVTKEKNGETKLDFWLT